MVVDGGHQEDAAAGALEIGDLDDDGQRLDHEQPADDGQHDLVLDADGDGAQRAAKRRLFAEIVRTAVAAAARGVAFEAWPPVLEYTCVSSTSTLTLRPLASTWSRPP